VPERCTCGATLPEDALFCHRCGKPQRELLAVEPEPEQVQPPPIPIAAAAPPPPPPIGFRNGTAVGIALVAGFLSILIFALGVQLTPVLAPAWLVLSGMLAAFLYKMGTGRKLSAIAGARLGWISGIFAFTIVAVLLGIFATVMLKDPVMQAAFRDRMSQMGQPSADVDKFIEAMHHPSNVLLALPPIFLLFTVLSAFGGAIGARLLNRD